MSHLLWLKRERSPTFAPNSAWTQITSILRREKFLLFSVATHAWVPQGKTSKYCNEDHARNAPSSTEQECPKVPGYASNLLINTWDYQGVQCIWCREHWLFSLIPSVQASVLNQTKISISPRFPQLTCAFLLLACCKHQKGFYLWSVDQAKTPPLLSVGVLGRRRKPRDLLLQLRATLRTVGGTKAPWHLLPAARRHLLGRQTFPWLGPFPSRHGQDARCLVDAASCMQPSQ